jgi:ferritin-like metal-binding protein YciE
VRRPAPGRLDQRAGPGYHAQVEAVEHYEIARYGALKTWATQLGYKDAAKLLDETLQEETKTDELLSQIAKRINVEGSEGDMDEAEAAPKRGSKAKAA